MKQMLFLLPLLLSLSLSGCLGQSEWEVLKVGMTAEEVVTVEGKPHDLWKNQDKTVLEAVWLDDDGLHRKLWVRFNLAYDEVKPDKNMTIRHNFRWELAQFLRYSYGGHRFPADR